MVSNAMRMNAGEKVQVALLKSVIVSLENFLKNDILNVELLSLTGKSNIIGSVFIYIFIQNWSLNKCSDVRYTYKCVSWLSGIPRVTLVNESVSSPVSVSE